MRTLIYPQGIKLAPETPGVYQFRDANGHILYIGKAKNLRNRLKSYTALKLHPKTARMVSDARTITVIEVESEFEALLLEANLVRSNMPLYNIELKDDKSPLYIGITKEEFPRILTLRQTDLKTIELKYTFGPYVDGRSTKYVLRLLRRIFPFSQHKIGKRGCIYSQIGLCNPCPNVIHKIEDPAERGRQKEMYLGNVKRIRLVLSGKLRNLQTMLYREMREVAKTERYEEAQTIKNQIERLNAMIVGRPKTADYVRDPNLLNETREKEAEELLRLLENHLSVEKLSRIECFDVAHLSGTNPTASLVTFIDGEPAKEYYRHFKIKRQSVQNNDVMSMKEVLTRRMKHETDWGLPDLIIIDGGKPQIAAAHEIIGDRVPIVGLAKRYETLVFFVNGKFIERRLPQNGAKNLVVRLRDEAHRFARRLHHNLVTKTLLKK